MLLSHCQQLFNSIIHCFGESTHCVTFLFSIVFGKKRKNRKQFKQICYSNFKCNTEIFRSVNYALKIKEIHSMKSLSFHWRQNFHLHFQAFFILFFSPSVKHVELDCHFYYWFLPWRWNKASKQTTLVVKHPPHWDQRTEQQNLIWRECIPKALNTSRSTPRWQE